MATAIATIGHNGAPEPTPYEAHSIHIADLMETAQGFLDGDPITTEAMAEEVNKLLDDARKARAAAEEQRKVEAKPHDDAKKAVQALWTPLTDEKTGKCALIASTAKKALAPYLAAKQKAIDDAAIEARRVADEKARLAQEALRAVNVTDLAAREQAETLLKDADRANKDANRAERGKAMVAGGARSVSLRSVWTPELTDAVAALKHYKAAQPEALKAWLLEQAGKDVAAGSRVIPGFTINEERVAQ